MNKWELKAEKLKYACPKAEFSFKTTTDIMPFDGIVGQERAAEALEFGLQINKQGYNIFISGETGTGRNKYSRSLIQEIAEKSAEPSDWCYLYNFEYPDQPNIVCVGRGKGSELKADMKKLLESVTQIIAQTLNSEQFTKARHGLMLEMQEQESSIFAELNEIARGSGLALKNTERGVITIPLNDEGNPMGEEEFAKISPEKSKEIDKHAKEVNRLVLEAFKKFKDIELETQNKISFLEKQLVFKSIEEDFLTLAEKYKEFSEVNKYIENVLKDIMANIKLFHEKEERPAFEFLLFKGDNGWDFTNRYKVNLLVDNSKTKGAPVIVESNPTYYNLVGKMEYENLMGIMKTDFTKIKPGALHMANGGFLIIQCRELLININSWHALKRALKTEKIHIENLGEQIGLIPTSALRPEPMPLNIKIVLIGSYYEYSLLYNYDDDFSKLFKIKADFDTEMDRNKDNIEKIAQIICYHCQKDDLLKFDSTALAKIIEHSSRLAEHQGKLSTRFNDLIEIIYEAEAWAKLDKRRTVQKKHVLKALTQKKYRSAKIEQKVRELIADGTLLIDTAEAVVGQVNGLTVIDFGEYSFGKPVRITANTYIGKSGIVNIEREVKMSGPVHDKGVLILNGYLGEKFGNIYPLSFSASICMEQSYGNIDGDSASSAELYALLSSLAKLPIKQGIAVTGSVNQKGFLQPIGGVNQKIEGFFAVCENRGLDGEQGVIIPEINVKNLMLSDEVITAVRKKQFHIYAVKKIEQGMEILTGVSWKQIMKLVLKRIEDIHKFSQKDRIGD